MQTQRQITRKPVAMRKVEASFLLTSIVFSSIVYFNFIGDRSAYGSAGFIFWANLLLLLVSYQAFSRILIFRPARMKMGGGEIL